MNDRELADKVVALGVGERTKHKAAHHKWFLYDGLEASDFVRDWRVAGALMERCQAVFVEGISGNESGTLVWGARADKAYGNRTRRWHETESLPRAIIEACVEALDD